MADIYLIIYVLLIISVPILGIWFLSVNYRKPKIPVDYSILLNYMNGWTDSGHFEGVIVKEVKGKRRNAIVYIPTDINHVQDYIERKGKKRFFKAEIPKQIIWYEKHQRKDMPRGTLSPDRNYVIIYPRVPQDLPELLKESVEGKNEMYNLANRNAERTVQDILQIETERTTQIAKLLGGKEPLSADYLAMI